MIVWVVLKFRRDLHDLNDDPRPGRPEASSRAELVEKVREIIAIDAIFTVRMLAEGLNLSYCRIYTIFTEDSPNLSPCDYFLFPKLKTAMKGAFYDDVPTIQAAVTQVLKNVTKT